MYLHAITDTSILIESMATMQGSASTSTKELKACGTHKLSLAVSVTARQ
jgi:hypothetical protein